MLFVQWDTHLRLLSLLGDANQHWPWKFSLCEAHEVHNKITSVDTVILKGCFTPSVSGLKLRGAAPSLAYKGLQVPQALLLQQRKWSLVLVCSPTVVIIFAVPCSAHDFLPCPISNVWIYCGVNQGKTDWYPKSPAAEKRDFLEWQCCLLPVASSPDQRNAITNQLLCKTYIHSTYRHRMVSIHSKRLLQAGRSLDQCRPFSTSCDTGLCLSHFIILCWVLILKLFHNHMNLEFSFRPWKKCRAWHTDKYNSV